MSVVPHWCRQHVAYILRESRALLHLSAQQCSRQSQSQALLQQGAGSRRVSAALWCQDPSAFCLPVLCWQETPETSHDNAMIVSTSFHIYPLSLFRALHSHTSSSSSILCHLQPLETAVRLTNSPAIQPWTAQTWSRQEMFFFFRRLSEHGQAMFFWIELLPATFLFVEDVDIRIYNCVNHYNAVGHLQSTSFFC